MIKQLYNATYLKPSIKKKKSMFATMKFKLKCTQLSLLLQLLLLITVIININNINNNNNNN